MVLCMWGPALVCVCTISIGQVSHLSQHEHYKPEAENATFSPLWWCWSLCVTRNPNARTANNVDLDSWELEWIHLASSSSVLLYNPTGCIGIYRMYKYRRTALPAEVCIRPHKWSTAANCSPEVRYNSAPIQTSQHLPLMKHAFVLG